jgi:hypothetical protein
MAAKNDWPKYDWGRVRHSYLKVVPATLLVGVIIQGIKYVVNTYLDWRISNWAYVFLTVIALFIIGKRLRYTPSANARESQE